MTDCCADLDANEAARLRRLLDRQAPLPLLYKVVSRVTLSLLLAFLWIPVTLLPLGASSGNPAPRCDVASASSALARAGFTQPRILAGNGYGPEFLYRSRATVISTPYHRNVSGILDALDAFEAEPLTAQLLLERRGIEIVAVCAGDADDFSSAAPGSFFGRLLAAQPPAFVTPLGPAKDTGGFLLYRVRAGRPDPGHTSR